MEGEKHRHSCGREEQGRRQAADTHRRKHEAAFVKILRRLKRTEGKVRVLHLKHSVHPAMRTKGILGNERPNLPVRQKEWS